MYKFASKFTVFFMPEMVSCQDFDIIVTQLDSIVWTTLVESTLCLTYSVVLNCRGWGGGGGA